MRTQAYRDGACALVQPPVALLLQRRVNHGVARESARASAEREDEQAQNGTYDIAPRITHVDKAIIRGYFRQRGAYAVFTDGTSARNALCKPWRLRSPLPPQLHTALLPAELEQKLSTLAVGYERVKVGGDVLLVETTTRTVIDVVHDIIAYQ